MTSGTLENITRFAGVVQMRRRSRWRAEGTEHLCPNMLQGVVPGAGEQENDPSKAPCFSPTHRLDELHNPDRGT